MIATPPIRHKEINRSRYSFMACNLQDPMLRKPNMR